MISWTNIEQAQLHQEKFPWFECKDCFSEESKAMISEHFPDILTGGSYPLESLKLHPKFDALMCAIRSDKMSEIVGKKMGMNLNNLSTTLTVRGHCEQKNGKPHVDSRNKLVTVLIYLNQKEWDTQEGKLRLLNSDKLEDYFAEIEPTMGTMLVFKCTDNAWHGHLPFVGHRRAIQLNWVKSAKHSIWENTRHRLSAFFKQRKLKKATNAKVLG